MAALITQLVDDYCSGWNEADPTKRRELMLRLWAPEPTYIDPTVHLTGVQSLVDHIEQVRARRPGAVWHRTGSVDTHHGFARFAFSVMGPDEELLLSGLDIVDLSPDGDRLQRIVGFFNT